MNDKMDTVWRKYTNTEHIEYSRLIIFRKKHLEIKRNTSLAK